MIEGKKCAAIILNYNDADSAISFKDSIKGFDLIDYIIIIDNCSQDGSYEKLRQITDLKVIVVKTEKNGGYGYGNNYGVNVASDLSCDIAFICNSDIVVDENCFQTIARCLLDNSEAAICSAIQINGYTKQPIKGVAWRLPTTFDYIRNSLVLLKRIVPVKDYDYINPLTKVDCVPGAFLGVDIAKFQEIGGYDEGIFLFCEESVLGARAQKKGYSTYLCTNCAYYHFHSTSIKKSYPKEINTFKLTLKSRRYYLKKYRNANGMLLKVVDLMFGVGLIEQSILFRIRH